MKGNWEEEREERNGVCRQSPRLNEGKRKGKRTFERTSAGVRRRIKISNSREEKEEQQKKRIIQR